MISKHVAEVIFSVVAAPLAGFESYKFLLAFQSLVDYFSNIWRS